MTYSAFDLTGQVALVTGGNGGIGLGMAEALARAGADIAIWGTNGGKNAAARDRLAMTGRRVLALECDVGDEAAVAAAFAETLSVLGRVDGCFANAGTAPAGVKSFGEMSSQEWHRVLRVNLDGAFYTFRAAVRHMVQRGGAGVLVGTASVAALHGSPRSEHYAATKSGLVGMVRGLAVEYARHGIRAHCILPGWIETDMTEALTSDERYQSAVRSRIPLRRWGDGADFGGIAVYAMSSASSYHTGDTFVIDGGYTLY
jgi:NAD(P)-dependent dehydrogenase (short-subunit alcohol dehydrogenase family)